MLISKLEITLAATGERGPLRPGCSSFGHAEASLHESQRTSSHETERSEHKPIDIRKRRSESACLPEKMERNQLHSSDSVDGVNGQRPAVKSIELVTAVVGSPLAVARTRSLGGASPSKEGEAKFFGATT